MTSTQTDSFVPLTTDPVASRGERAEFKATVMSELAETQKFQIASPLTTSSAAPATPHVADCQPQVNVQRDGNRVMGIHIQCSCGEVIDLSCVYEAAGAQLITPSESATQPEPATIPPSEAVAPKPGKICKDSGKDLPTSASKKPKAPEKGRGTAAAKRSSA